MDEFREALKSYILNYTFYNEENKHIGIIKKDELAKLIQVDEVKFEE